MAPRKSNLEPLLAPLPIQHIKSREPENRGYRINVSFEGFSRKVCFSVYRESGLWVVVVGKKFRIATRVCFQ